MLSDSAFGLCMASVYHVSVFMFVLCQSYCTWEVKVKVKATPFQTWTDPEGSRRFRLPDFMTVGT